MISKRSALAIILAVCVPAGAALVVADRGAVSEKGSPTNRTLSSEKLIPSPPGPATPAGEFYPRRWLAEPEIGALILCRDPGSCVECHPDQASMDPSHAFPCADCHAGNPAESDQDAAHEGLIADPGDLTTVDRTCGKCHAEVVRRVKRSPMALATRTINHTRFAFGARNEPDAKFGTVGIDDIEPIPHPDSSKTLVDDLLRRSCLRCHLHTKGSQRWGEHRGKGCSACHVAYPNSADGRPRQHAIVRNVGMTACLKCHNNNHVGMDYVGLFEKDFNRGFTSPFVRGRQPPRIYGAEHHRLVSDVHFRAGMQCTECHTIDEIHGTGKIPTGHENLVRITCEGCHAEPTHPALLEKPDGTRVLLGKTERTVPKRNPDTIPHSIPEHRERVRCSACHAAWGFQDYGLHLMLEERADYWKWAPTAGQNDPQVQKLLRDNVGTYVELVPPQSGSQPAKPAEEWSDPTMTDWLNSEERAGAWFRGLTARRWENPPLGRDSDGRVSVMRPIYQYVISHVNKAGDLLLDRVVPTNGAGRPALVMNPYVPHTTVSTGRSCHECHGNPKALGLGHGTFGIAKPRFQPVWPAEKQIPGRSFRWDALVNDNKQPVQTGTHPGAGPLEPEIIEKLLNPSPRHKVLWHRYLGPSLIK